MKSQIRVEYKAEDGRIFSTMAACERHETLLRKVVPVMAPLPRIKIGTRQYYQHDPAALTAVWSDLWELVLEEHGESWPEWKKYSAEEVHPQSIVGRVLSDYNTPLYDAWYRFMCIDMDTGREYNQPYYVSHTQEAPEEATN